MVMPCCHLTGKPFIERDGTINVDLLTKAIEERLELCKTDKEKAAILVDIEKKKCKCECHVIGKIVLH